MKARYDMSMKILVGLDGEQVGGAALDHAIEIAKQVRGCTLQVAYVIEWSPFSFQTAEENEERHQRREEEIALAKAKIVEPAVSYVTEQGIEAVGTVRHGNVADVLNAIAIKDDARLIVVNRAAERGISARVFGSVTGNLVMSAAVPVTVVGPKS